MPETVEIILNVMRKKWYSYLPADVVKGSPEWLKAAPAVYAIWQSLRAVGQMPDIIRAARADKSLGPWLASVIRFASWAVLRGYRGQVI